ncbi:MAG: hypothetical protein QHC79_22445 [Pseudosphingobacterium sp.]|nr:hypothetical protein [Pseudosphingobacterium sp.]
MKKILFMVLMVPLAFSCRKERPVGQQDNLMLAGLNDQRQQTVENCKQWFEGKQLEKRKLAAVGQQTGDSQGESIGQPDWNHPTFFELTPNLNEFNRFPLKGFTVDCSFTDRMNPKGFRDLVMRKVGEGNFIAHILEIHPDEAYLAQKCAQKGLPEETDMRQLIDNEDFTGYFLVYSTENALKHGERRESGVVTTNLVIPEQ